MALNGPTSDPYRYGVATAPVARTLLKARQCCINPTHFRRVHATVGSDSTAGIRGRVVEAWINTREGWIRFLKGAGHRPHRTKRVGTSRRSEGAEPRLHGWYVLCLDGAP